MIPLHRPLYEKKEQDYVQSAMAAKPGQTSFCDACADWLSEYVGRHGLMTTSCSTALDMAAELLDAKPGDEVIVPSFTFASTANALVRQGLVPVFVDVRKDTLNLDETKIEEAITKKTVAVLPVHYAGVGCAMEEIGTIARRHGLKIIEDAAQGLYARYKGKPLGSFGDVSCMSFHETKNFSMGEGGVLFVKDKETFARAEVLAECGTERKKVLRGEAPEYTWIEKGISGAPAELACMFLYPQLLEAERITQERRQTWEFYRDAFARQEQKERLVLPHVPEECEHNGHIFALRVRNREERDDLLCYLKERGIGAAFHYLPLHTSRAGKRYGRFHGEDAVTTAESEKLLRLPLYCGMTQEEKEQVAEAVLAWCRENRKG